MVVGLYVLFGLTALAVDRRALLVSALAYVLYALTELFKQFGAVELNVALTALVIGSALLLLSAFLAPGAPHDRHAASGEPAGSAAEPRPAAMSSPNQPHKPALERGEHGRKLVPPLQHRTMFTNQGKRPLLQPKRGAFFYAHLGPLGVAAIGGEDGNIGIDPQRIVAPVAGSDHPAIEVEDAHQLLAVESGNWAPVP